MILEDLLIRWKYKIKKIIHGNKFSVSEFNDGPYKAEIYNPKLKIENSIYGENIDKLKLLAIEEAKKGNLVEIWELKFKYSS